MPKRYSMEMAGRAEQLYCYDGRTLSEVAALTGVSLRALKDWSTKHGWAAKQHEIGRSLMEIRTKTIQLRQKLIENALNSLSAEDIYAVASMESIARRAVPDDSRNGAVPAPETVWKTKGEVNAIAALEQACRIRMSCMLADPGQMSLSAIRGLKAAIELVRDFKEGRGHGRTKGRRRGISDETAEEIRRKILGIRDEEGEHTAFLKGAI
jgi:hypothetical protein